LKPVEREAVVTQLLATASQMEFAVTLATLAFYSNTAAGRYLGYSGANNSYANDPNYVAIVGVTVNESLGGTALVPPSVGDSVFAHGAEPHKRTVANKKTRVKTTSTFFAVPAPVSGVLGRRIGPPPTGIFPRMRHRLSPGLFGNRLVLCASVSFLVSRSLGAALRG
jgi:hypothetical protein